MALNVTTAVFAENCNTATASPSLAQWDTEQVLQISGIDLPDSYKVEFSTVYTRNAIPKIGDASGVDIPNELLQRSAPITAYIVLYGENGGRNREYWITIYITPGQPPETITPDPEQADVIDEAIAALNNGVARTEAAATSAEGSARDAEAAAEAVQNLSVAAETLATGEPATVEKTVDEETGAVTLNFGLPRGAKGDPFRYEDFTEAQKAELVQGPIKASQDAAVEAVNAAGTTQTGNVNQAGTTNVNAVNQAGTTQVNAVNQTGATQVQAVEDKGDEVLNSIPQDYTDLVDDVADLSRQLSDVEEAVNDAAPVIINTASGDIASFADGADNRQIRKIVGTIVPVQSGSGDPSPDNERPISGWTGANIGNVVPSLVESPITFTPTQQGSGTPSPDNVRDIVPGLSIKRDDGTNLVIYGGTLTVNQDGTGSVKNTLSAATLNGSETWSAVSGNTAFFADGALPSYRTASDGSNWICNKYQADSAIRTSGDVGARANKSVFNQSGAPSYFERVFVKDTSYASASELAASLVDSPLVVVYESPEQAQTTYNLSVTETVRAVVALGLSTTILPINWQSEAGTIYGGKVTLNEDGSADVVSNWGIVDLGTLAWYELSYKRFTSAVLQNMKQYGSTDIAPIISSELKSAPKSSIEGADNQVAIADGSIWVCKKTATNATNCKELLAGVQLVYELTTPQSYHFVNVGQLFTFFGANNIWCDTGDITELIYPADTKLYIDSLTAPDEDMIADANIASGKYFSVNNKLYLSTAAIAAGASIIPGTNCTETNLAEALNSLNS